MSGRCSCGRAPFYTRRYSGEVLCPDCFTNSIVEKTRRTIAERRMIRRGDRVGVAVSGGKDSLSLLHVLHALGQRHGAELVAISVDEGVRGYRDEALSHAAALCSRLDVEHRIVSYKELFGFTLDEALDWNEERVVSSCSFCGVFRRRAIDEAATMAKVSVVATAHNLDDFVQTFLMNLMHGDVNRLSWLDLPSPVEGFPMRRVKPFMEIYEEEIALFAYSTGLPFQSVSCPYMHEGLRSEVRDYLNKLEAGHPGMKNVLFRSSQEVVSRLEGASAKRSVPCTVCGRPSSGGVCSVCRMKEELRQHVK